MCYNSNFTEGTLVIRRRNKKTIDVTRCGTIVIVCI